ncbi:hypothetical protein B0J11DRAFT_575660 [Dendryphion nanum]|uniref:Carbonic anhydrase n=1 Tax=Dendryphion nanum TaxID=256645 RepID=A0A9P9EBW9_9PLEO|nr:hypothetical protein B0J11DRAFT_575660 [Dendryphion nanum]
MSSGTLVIISCDENSAHVDPARYFNLSVNTTSVIKTPGGRTDYAIHPLYTAEQSSRIGMIIVVQHTCCTRTTANVEHNIRTDIAALKASPYVRNGVPIIGYLLDIHTSQLREISVPTNGQDDEARRKVLSEMDDFGPFWS